MTVKIYEANKEIMMNKENIEDQVLKKINLVLSEFKDYEQAFIDFKGNIIIKNKVEKTPKKEKLILTCNNSRTSFIVEQFRFADIHHYKIYFVKNILLVILLLKKERA